MSTKRKTVAQQRKRTAEKHPQIQLVPDEAGADQPKHGQETCGATRWLHGIRVECVLPAGHAGDHHNEGRMWRRRSGDNA